MKETSIRVADYMTEHHQPIHCGTPLSEVVERLIHDHLTGLPVVDDHRRVIGFVSEQDCVKQALEDSYYCNQNARVNEVMRKDVLTVSPNDDIIEVAQRIINHQPKIYPVVKDEKLVGIITRADILKALTKHVAQCY